MKRLNKALLATGLAAGLLAAGGAFAEEPAAGTGTGTGAHPVGLLAREHSICAAYDYVASECLGRMPDGEELSARYGKVARQMFRSGYLLAKQTGMDDETFTSRFNEHLERVKTQIGHSCDRVTELTEIYANSCKRLAEHPDEVFDDLLAEGEPDAGSDAEPQTGN